MSFWRILSLWLPVGAFMSALYYVSSRADLAGVPTGWDKVLHTGAYTALGVLSLRAFHGGLQRLGRGPTLGAVLLTVSYALLDELHQSHVVGRHASALDWAADVAGAALAVVVVGGIITLRGRPSGRSVEGG